jgi:hypothetical protein
LQQVALSIFDSKWIVRKYFQAKGLASIRARFASCLFFSGFHNEIVRRSGEITGNVAVISF